MSYNRAEIVEMLSLQGAEAESLFERSAALKLREVGDKLYLRGLIEYSNVCRKNCLYCGIRCDQKAVSRYTLTADEVLQAARYAHEHRFGSLVLQAGEITSVVHTATIESLIRAIKQLSSDSLGITLSLGEQSPETYRRWFEAGAHRYLLRIESSSPERYARIHPKDALHRYEDRLAALYALRDAGYQLGTGVMIGLPQQTVEDLADDLLFMRDMDVDMCGMGPYIESEGTPLSQHGVEVPSVAERVFMSLKMIAVLRLLMPDINIAATTALQSLDADARLRAVHYGANVIMPNITPEIHRANYNLYNAKAAQIDPRLLDFPIAYGEWGDSLHAKREKKR